MTVSTSDLGTEQDEQITWSQHSEVPLLQQLSQYLQAPSNPLENLTASLLPVDLPGSSEPVEAPAPVSCVAVLTDFPLVLDATADEAEVQRLLLTFITDVYPALVSQRSAMRTILLKVRSIVRPACYLGGAGHALR